jgi:catechol 2,3-dioxygenase-like lactoylglutathione lyase family enzyme
MIDVLGMDHIYLTVSAMDRSVRFYDQVLVGLLGFRKNEFELHGERHVNYYNRQFGLVLRPASPQLSSAHNSRSPGLHHLCLRVETSSDVAAVAQGLRACGIDASGPEAYPQYASDYVATFFHDPDGIRLEVTNFREERRRRQQHWNDDAG